MRTFLIFLFVASVSLFIYNPTLTDFDEHLDEMMFEEQHEDARTGLIGRTLEGENTTFNVSQISRSVQRNNFFLFSTYEVELNEEEVPLGQSPYMSFVGIGGMFFQTSP